jgi:hypothetical protein
MIPDFKYKVLIAVIFLALGIGLGFVLFHEKTECPLGSVPTWENIGGQTWDLLK